MARILFLCFFLLAYAGEARATSCVRPDNIMKYYPVVFKGTAISTEAANEIVPPKDDKKKEERLAWVGEPLVTTFRIVEGYKGVGGYGTEIKVFHWSKTPYNPNETYVVFALIEEGRIGAPTFCNPGAKTGEIDTNSELFSQLKIYNHQAEYLRKLITAHPDNPYFYLEQGTFHEKYGELELAVQDYKTGLMKVTGKGLSDAMASSSLHSAPFIEGYNRVLSQQKKVAP